MVSCKKVIIELSDYLSGEASETLLREMEGHLAGCNRCSVLVDSTRKMLVISGDDRTFEVPVGYSRRLHEFLDSHVLATD